MARSPQSRLPHVPSLKRANRMLAVLRSVNARGAVTTAELEAELRVSAATLRRDLAEMHDQGLLIRTRGGAAPLPSHAEVPVQLRDLESREVKHRLAVRATELVPTGRVTVALTGGTTTAEIARALAHRRDLTVVTNALPIATDLASRPRTRVLLVGGVVRPVSLELVGGLAEQAYEVIDVDLAILGVDGFSAEGGATTHDESEARISRILARRAPRVMVVAAGAKIGVVTPARMADAARVELLVTDSSADPAELRRLQAAGVVVHVVEPTR